MEFEKEELDMDVGVCKITECQDVEILDVINNKDQKSEVAEVAQCRKVGVKFNKVKLKTQIKTQRSFHALVVQAAGYEKLIFDQKDVRNMLQ
ncbi:hypothetical protein C5167_037838 [Papaver somniferum]|uniref:Uncharacterized protein n=1 Tax=Papaver somniferum TaxID=3469 RepID=A0A4Y7IAZ5_PAPSO|nr:hypothetical protein C5167_037838 [Papaver somniferum]